MKSRIVLSLFLAASLLLQFCQGENSGGNSTGGPDVGGTLLTEPPVFLGTCNQSSIIAEYTAPASTKANIQSDCTGQGGAWSELSPNLTGITGYCSMNQAPVSTRIWSSNATAQTALLLNCADWVVLIPPSVSFTDANSTAIESTAFLRIQVKLSEPASKMITVPLAFSGTATRDSDYTAASSVTIPAKSTTADVMITLKEDGIVEGQETVLIDLQTTPDATVGNPARHTLNITDNDPQVFFATGTGFGNEDDGTKTITVSLSATSSQTITVPYTVSGTATSADHGLVNGSVTFNPGVTSAAINLPLVFDAIAEADETVIITLGNPSNASLGATTVFTFTIKDMPVIKTYDTFLNSQYIGMCTTASTVNTVGSISGSKTIFFSDDPNHPSATSIPSTCTGSGYSYSTIDKSFDLTLYHSFYCFYGFGSVTALVYFLKSKYNNFNEAKTQCTDVRHGSMFDF